MFLVLVLVLVFPCQFMLPVCHNRRPHFPDSASTSPFPSAAHGITTSTRSGRLTRDPGVTAGPGLLPILTRGRQEESADA